MLAESHLSLPQTDGASVKTIYRIPQSHSMDQRLTAILLCNDLDAQEAFFKRLGFARRGKPNE